MVSPFNQYLFRPRWIVNNNGQYNEDKAGPGATLCPAEAGGWPSQPVVGKLRTIRKYYILEEHAYALHFLQDDELTFSIFHNFSCFLSTVHR